VETPKDNPKPKPSRRCPHCREFIEGEPVLYDHREYCSSDCAIDAWEEAEAKRKEFD